MLHTYIHIIGDLHPAARYYHSSLERYDNYMRRSLNFHWPVIWQSFSKGEHEAIDISALCLKHGIANLFE